MAKILIVDDAFVIREKLRSIFSKAGHDIVGEASNGLQAVHLYKRLKPDIVTMDITMPGMDGMEGLQKIKAFDSNACILCISSMSQKKVAIDALEAGAVAFILKPFDEWGVLTVVEKIRSRIEM